MLYITNTVANQCEQIHWTLERKCKDVNAVFQKLEVYDNFFIALLLLLVLALTN